MPRIPRQVCGVIPPHMSKHLAARSPDHGADASATLAQMREIATGRARNLIGASSAVATRATKGRKIRCVYDAHHDTELPGTLVMTEDEPDTEDVEAREAYDGSGTSYDFLARVLRRRSIDHRGMRLVSTVHYGDHFPNALWNGEQIVYGDGDGEIFNRFTRSLDVIGHEIAHGVTQFSAALGYAGQNGAVNEHLADVIGMMVRQWARKESAKQSNWCIGSELFSPKVKACGVRSMANPGTAYDDPILGRDPQPAHMRDYVETEEDNGGVHINSGILNRAFCLAGLELGGYTWEKPGRLWYLVLTKYLLPDADFYDFVDATTAVAGKEFGTGSRVQRIIHDAWGEVGLAGPIYGWDAGSRRSSRSRPNRPAAASSLSQRRQRHAH